MTFPFKKVVFVKCFNSIVLPDCATIALAIKNNIPALFAKKESELIAQLVKKKFEIEIYFLEDFIDHSKI